jgi:hypothetical protein
MDIPESAVYNTIHTVQCSICDQFQNLCIQKLNRRFIQKIENDVNCGH